MKRPRIIAYLLTFVLCLTMLFPAVTMAEDTTEDFSVLFDEPEMEIFSEMEDTDTGFVEDCPLIVSDELQEESSSVAEASADILGASVYKTRLTDTTEAREGYQFATVRGTFYKTAKKTVLKRINEIRYEACKEGVINPDTGKKLTVKNYVPIKWSSDLEWIAQTRAAEASVIQKHQRPNCDYWFSCTHNGVESWSEVLAWNYSGMMQGIEQWYEEKADWVKQNSAAVTGHYEALIDPGNTYVALGCFLCEYGGFYTVSGEFSYVDGLDETQSGVSGPYDQVLEIPDGLKSQVNTFQGSSKSLFNAKISGVYAKTYTGEKITPVPTVKVGSKKLTKGTDYTVSYKKNKSIGTASVIIIGRGAYAGFVVKTFKINPQGADITKIAGKEESFKVFWEKKGTVATGVQIQYSLTSDFSSKKTKTVSDTEAKAKTISGLLSGKKYYVKIRTYKSVSGKKYYSGWSEVKTVKVK